MKTIKRARCVLLLAVMLAVLLGGIAQSSESRNRGVLVSPARLVATVKPGEQLSPVRVKNATNSPVEIDVYVGRAEHRWNGSPIYFDSPAERSWGARHLGLDQTHLLLEPGELSTITATIGDLSDIRGGFYPVIFVEIRPPKGSVGTVAVSRLAVLTLLQVVGSKPSDLAVTTLDIDQANPGEPIGVFPLIMNQGEVHASFSGYIEIAHVGGDIGTRLPVQPMTVLPGCSRQLALWWHPEKLPVGTYRVNAHLSAGGEPIEAGQWAFQVNQPYELASTERTIDVMAGDTIAQR
ncbi:MAG: hypothetical protein GX998_10760 [Firmicutes bacterium]|nr:hypothetical protein [Bacillota bacterium]